MCPVIPKGLQVCYTHRMIHAEESAKRFWSKVSKDGPVPKHAPELGPCWPRAGYKNPKGYGSFHHPGTQDSKRYPAHRFAWILENGEIPKGMQVTHRCDNPACVRHSHLRLGTNQNNVDEMVARGRCIRTGPKLKESEAREILGAHGTIKARELAETYGVGEQAVYAIWAGTTWKRLSL